MMFEFQSKVLRGWIGFALILAAIGCSVKTADVPNQPARIKRGLHTSAVEFGTLSPELFSAFFWPEGLQGKDLEIAVGRVNELSRTMDQAAKEAAPFMLQRDDIKMAISKQEALESRLVQEFKQARCAQLWANVPEGTITNDIIKIEQWKDADPADVSAQQSRSQCQANQLEREKIQQEIVGLQQKLTSAQSTIDQHANTQLQASEQITQLINVNRTKNFLEIPAKSASIVIRPEQVTVTLKNYQRKGNHQSTDPLLTKVKGAEIHTAQYDPALRALRFSVPEVSESGALTGRTYVFDLGRNVDFLGRARFTGDIKLVMDGKTLRNGSVKIDGKME